MQAVIDKLIAAGAALDDKMADFIKAKAKFPSQFDELRTTNEIDYKTVFSRCSVLPSLVNDLTSQNIEKFQLVSVNRLIGFQDQIVAVNGALTAVTELIRSIGQWGGVSRIDPNNGIIHATNNQTQQTRAPMDELSNKIDNALESRITIAAQIRPKAIGTFVAAAKTMLENAEKSEEAIDSLAARLQKLDQRSKKIEGLENSVQSLLEPTQKSSEEIKSVNADVLATLEQVRTTKAQVEEVGATAKTLKESVGNYQSDFDSFQELLQARKDEIAGGRTQLETLIGELESEKTKIDELNGKANEMLGGATIAGLSDAYRVQNSELDDQIFWTQCFFYGSILFLFLSAAISLNLIPFLNGLPKLPAFGDNTPVANIIVQVFASIGSRALILLPALIIIGFTAKRYSNLFRLRQEYSHKYNTAASVHGFKQQAPDYQQQIAAAVFEELMDNPAKALDTKEPSSDDANGNSFIEKLLKPHIERALRKMNILDEAQDK